MYKVSLLRPSFGVILAHLGVILASSWLILANLGSSWRHLGSPCRHLGVQSALGGIIFELHFHPEKSSKSRSRVGESSISGILVGIFVSRFFSRAFSQNMKSKSSPVRELDFGGPVASVVTFAALVQRLVICVFLDNRLVIGGY